MQGLGANVNINTFEDESTLVTFRFSGDDNLATLKVTNNAGALTLEEDTGNTASGSTAKELVIQLGDIYINDASVDSDAPHSVTRGAVRSGASKPLTIPTLDITCSQATQLKLAASVGRWEIGDTVAAFDAQLDGQAQVNVTSITNGARIDIGGSGNFSANTLSNGNLTATISGSGKIHFNNVNVEKADCVISGKGDIFLQDGTITSKLTSHVPGTGNVYFGGTTAHATYNTSEGAADDIEKIVASFW